MPPKYPEDSLTKLFLEQLEENQKRENVRHEAMVEALRSITAKLSQLTVQPPPPPDPPDPNPLSHITTNTPIQPHITPKVKHYNPYPYHNNHISHPYPQEWRNQAWSPNQHYDQPQSKPQLHTQPQAHKHSQPLSHAESPLLPQYQNKNNFQIVFEKNHTSSSIGIEREIKKQQIMSEKYSPLIQVLQEKGKIKETMVFQSRLYGHDLTHKLNFISQQIHLLGSQQSQQLLSSLLLQQYIRNGNKEGNMDLGNTDEATSCFNGGSPHREEEERRQEDEEKETYGKKRDKWKVVLSNIGGEENKFNSSKPVDTNEQGFFIPSILEQKELFQNQPLDDSTKSGPWDKAHTVSLSTHQQENLNSLNDTSSIPVPINDIFQKELTLHIFSDFAPLHSNEMSCLSLEPLDVHNTWHNILSSPMQDNVVSSNQYMHWNATTAKSSNLEDKVDFKGVGNDRMLNIIFVMRSIRKRIG